MKDVPVPVLRLQTSLVAALALSLVQSLYAQQITPLASYEPAEADLIVTPGGADAGLTVATVQGGVSGAPAATDGDYVLRLSFTGEDGKVEIRHDWSITTYDLGGNDQLLADVYVETPSAVPGLMGVWSPNWNPPDNWQSATGVPTQTGVWTTVTVDVSQRAQTGLNNIVAFVFENMPGSDGVIYVDNLRLSGPGVSEPPPDLAALAFGDRIELTWPEVANNDLDGYHVYRAGAAAGPFTQLTSTPIAARHYVDANLVGNPLYYYQVTAVIDGQETAPTATASAMYNGVDDEAMLDLTQQAAFYYFWDYGHPVCGAAREGYTHAPDIVATGGSGMGLMAIIVGSERGWITRQEAADRVLQILSFFEDDTTRYHGAWAHWINGTTGATIPFSTFDDGGDIVETSFFAQGLLTVRRYFDGGDATETEIRTRATRMWEAIEWDWYLRFPGGETLYWHWSPNFGWQMNLPIHGYMEAMITYLLAMASPTHPIPASCYVNGWAGQSWYANGSTYFGIELPVGPAFGGPLFFQHYSFLGFDPRYKRDMFCDYFENARATSLIHHAYGDQNPQGFAGYHRWGWGLTASTSPPPWNYSAHSPTNDNGTIAPTAALSSMPYTPKESIETLRYFTSLGANLWGPYGLYDAYNPSENWWSDTYIAIDEGPIVVMIENYRTGLFWDLFMANPEIQPMLFAAGWSYDADLSGDGVVDSADTTQFVNCLSGPDAPFGAGCDSADLDTDGDVDLCDTAEFQRAFSVR